MRIPKIRQVGRALAMISGGLLAVTIGLACLRFSFGEPLARYSYDLPFILRSTLDTHEVALVYLDDDSAKQLHQPVDNLWNRSLHVSLLDRLAQDHSRLVFYDVVFDEPAAEPGVDAAFADSIRRHGKVILGAALDKIIDGVCRRYNHGRIDPHSPFSCCVRRELDKRGILCGRSCI